MGLGIPPLRIKIMLESDPLQPTMLVGRLAMLVKIHQRRVQWKQGVVIDMMS